MSANKKNRYLSDKTRQSKKASANRKKKAAGGSQLRSWWGRVVMTVAVLAGVSAGFVGAYAALVRCDWFDIETVTVKGACLLKPQTVLRQARLKSGDNLLGINLYTARRRLLAHPWIASARFRRVLPSTIVVNIREHSPQAVVDLGRRYFIDEKGELFKPVSETDPESLPVITGLDYKDLDKTARPDSRLFKSALNAVETERFFEDEMASVNIERISADRDMGITLHISGRIDKIQLGFDEERDHYRKKMKRLANVLTHMKKAGRTGHISAVCLECPDRVVVAPAAGHAFNQDIS